MKKTPIVVKAKSQKEINRLLSATFSDLLQKHGLSRQDVLKRTSIADSTMSDTLSGFRNWNLKKITKVSHAFGISLSEFLRNAGL